MKEMNNDQVTMNLLQFCYTCDDAAACASEEICRHCWAEQGIPVDEEQAGSEIGRMINAYYE
ncbi:hypothetical protein [Gorillibacterium timonense]|uniref:hypothetical protein n=1 Tax=Gorillibacterium timonense TaxID=1689269 RepID=UPI00071CD5A0|nr:hypothetical protein [Gorillibacterium timonense]